MARWWRPDLLVVLLAAGAVVTWTVGVPPVEEIRTWVRGAGWAGPVLYAGLYAVLSLTPAPATVFSVGGGVLFGWAVGMPVVLAGALAGAAAGFGLARVLGRGALPAQARLDAVLRRRGLLAVVGVRLVPVVPFAVLNAACGLTALSTRDYLVGSAIGMTPAVAAFVAVGAYGTDPFSVPFLLAAGGLSLLVGGGAAVARHRGRWAAGRSTGQSASAAPRPGPGRPSDHSRSARSAVSVRSRAISSARAAVSRSG